MSIIQNSINRFRRLRNHSSFISSRKISIHHNYSYNSESNKDLEKKLEEKLKVSNIMIIILSIILLFIIIYNLFRKYMYKCCKKRSIIPIKNDISNRLDNNIPTANSKLSNHTIRKDAPNVPKSPNAPSITSSLSINSLRRIKSDSDIETNPRSPKSNVLNINENIRETISEPPDNSEYMDDRIRKDFMNSSLSNHSIENDNKSDKEVKDINNN
jgi:hypothetical protein